MSRDPHHQLARSWEANARAWTEAVRQGAIYSRRAGTDAAIVEAVLERHPRRVLDLGCGEGWLVRSLGEQGIEVVGIDASAALIERARDEGGGAFHVCSYVELVGAPEQVGAGYDTIVCNFALLEEDVAPVLRALHSRLAPGGVLLIQTVHPWAARGNEPYRDGWRTETFAGFGDEFTEPMPWYFRTLESWVQLLHGSGYRVEDLREPVHEGTGEPLSLLLFAVPAA